MVVETFTEQQEASDDTNLKVQTLILYKSTSSSFLQLLHLLHLSLCSFTPPLQQLPARHRSNMCALFPQTVFGESLDLLSQ